MNRSMINIAVVLAAVGSAVLPGPEALAQGKQMYRCGSNYQDRPCDGVAPGAAKAAPATGAKPAPSSETAKAGPAAAAPGASAGTASANAAPVLTKAQQQRQIRCENFGRQLDELKERQKAAPTQAEAMNVQVRSLQSRMSADGC